MPGQTDFYTDPNDPNYWRYWNAHRGEWADVRVPKLDASGRFVERPRSAESQGHVVMKPSWWEQRRSRRKGY